jgi:hypothetical protein
LSEFQDYLTFGYRRSATASTCSRPGSKPRGIKVAGTDLKEIDLLATRIEEVVKTVPGVTSALAERLTGGRYIDVDIDRAPRAGTA